MEDWSFNMAEQNNATFKSTQQLHKNPRQSGRRNSQAPVENKEFDEVVISIDRVARVVKGGRRFRFQALVVVGDHKNRVGIGLAKGGDVQTAVLKSTQIAKKHLINVPISNDTIPHDIEVKFSGARILLKPASPGSGIIAGGAIRQIIGVTGIKNLSSKSLGSANKINISYATIKALSNLVSKDNWNKVDNEDKSDKEA